MTRYLKGTALVIAGLCWMAFAIFLCLFLYSYLVGGAGMQIFGFTFSVSSATAFVGVIHFVGFSAAAFLSISVGVGLCAYGFVPAAEAENKVQNRDHLAGKTPNADAATSENSEVMLRCVCCRRAFATAVDLCPECGWTQPSFDHGKMV